MVEGGRSRVGGKGIGVVEGEAVVVWTFDGAAEAIERGKDIGWNRLDITSALGWVILVMSAGQVCVVSTWLLTWHRCLRG